MELTPYLFWNIFITLVLAPVLYSIRLNTEEAKRLDILLNKTREEIARDYATREQIEADFQRIMDSINNIDSKIDRLQNKTYFQD